MHFLSNVKLITCKKYASRMQTLRFLLVGIIGRSIGHRRKCAACEDILLVDRDNENFLSDNVPQDYMKLFDNADRASLAVPT